MEKRSGGLSTENSHLHTEDVQIQRKDQVDFTKALKTVTYMLRVHRQGEKVRWSSLKSRSTYIYVLHSHVHFIISQLSLYTEYFLTVWLYVSKVENQQKAENNTHLCISNKPRFSHMLNILNIVWYIMQHVPTVNKCILALTKQ